MVHQTPRRAPAQGVRERRMRAIVFVVLLPLCVLVGVGLATFILLVVGGCLTQGVFVSCIAGIPAINVYGGIVLTGPAGLAIAVPSLYWMIYRSSWLRWTRTRVASEKERRFMELP